MSRRMVVDSPPGRINASMSTRSRGRRTSTGSAPTSRMAFRCSRMAPCTARTPTRGRRASMIMGPTLPAASGEALLDGELACGDAPHRLTQACADLGQDLGVVVVRGRLDDRLRVSLGVLALEDAGADEDCLRPELAHEAGVRRGGNAARTEVGDRQLTQLRGLLDDVVWGAKLLGCGEQLVRAHGLELSDPLLHGTHVAHGLDDVAGSGLALGADHGRALADAPQRLPQVAAAAHERHLEVVLIDVVLLVGRREDLGLVDVVHLERLEDLGLGEVT